MLRVTIKGLGLFLVLASTQAFGFGIKQDTNAIPTGCLDQAAVSSVQSAFRINTKDLAQFDRCKPNTDSYKLIQALILIKGIRFQAGALKQPFNQDILPTDFWGYFTGRAKSLTEEESCQDNVLAYVYGWSNDGTVHLCPLLFDDRISISERSETMLHEARHFEGYSHVTCSRGPRNGMAGACDNSVEEKGSYAVTVESLTKMSLLANGYSPMDRALTKISALTYANEVFNKPIVPNELASVYLASDDNQGHFLDASDGSLRAAPYIDAGSAKLISRWASLSVYPNDKSNAYTLDTFSASFRQLDPLGSSAINYNKLDPAQRPDKIDVVNNDNLSASVNRDHITGSLSGETLDTEIALPWNAKQVFTGPELGLTDTDSLFILSDANQMYKVQFLPNQQFNITPAQNLAQGFKSLIVFNGQRLGLANDGQILVNKQGAWSPYAPLQGKKFLTLTRPFLWSSYFESTN